MSEQSDRMIPIYLSTAIADETRSALDAFAMVHSTLEKVLDWAASQQLKILDMIQQDEFRSDVIIQCDDALYLAYDVT